MTKDALNLDGLLAEKRAAVAAPGRDKRLSVVIDSATYKRLRIAAAETEATHQDILQAALVAWLDARD